MSMIQHESPRDRGSADRYYNRPYSPHYWATVEGQRQRINAAGMTQAQIAEYAKGWEETDDRKEWN